MPCKHCGISDNSLNVDIDSLPHSNDVLLSYVQTTDAEISRVEDLLNKLVLKRRLLKKKINYNSSPLLRLPADITSEIFKAYISNEDAQVQGPEFELWDGNWGVWPGCSSRVARLLFGSICRTWREFAWSLPWVWRSVSLVLGHPSTDSADLLDEWLSRSGHCALTISLQCEVVHEKAQGTVLDIISVVSRFSERWKHIILELPPLCFDTLRSVEGRVPLVESVFMYLHGNNSIYGVWNPLSMFSVAPKLREVHYEGFPILHVVLPIAQLYKLSGCRLDVIQALGALEASPNLEHAALTLGRMDDPRDILTSADSIPHPTLARRLQSLGLTLYLAIGETDALLDNLTLPNLLKLRLHVATRTNTGFGFSSFRSFILRSACPLQTLSLQLRLSDEELFRYLEVIPSLTELTISLRDITNQTIRNLQVTPNEAPLLPNLQRFKINHGTLLLDFTQLYNMLSSRRAVAHRTASSGHAIAEMQSVEIVTLDVDTETYRPAKRFLQELIAEGMLISVESTSVCGSTWV